MTVTWRRSRDPVPQLFFGHRHDVSQQDHPLPLGSADAAGPVVVHN